MGGDDEHRHRSMLSALGLDRLSRRWADTGSDTEGVTASGPARSPTREEVEEPARRAWRVPPPARVFLGRDELLEVLHGRLVDGPGPVVLRGPGGVGTTSLASAFANRYRDDYDVVWWLQAGEPALVDQQMLALAAALHLELSATHDVTSAKSALAAYLGGHDRWLLVLDEGEDADGLAPWLPDGPGHVLITATDGRAWAGHAQFAEVPRLDVSRAVELLCRLAPALAGDKEQAQAIAERLERLPLALVVAGGTLAQTGMSAPDYLTALQGHTDDLPDDEAPDREAPEGQAPDDGDSDTDGPLSMALKIAVTSLGTTDDGAAGLLEVCAHLAPETIPLTWWVGAVSANPARFAPSFVEAAASASRLRALAARLAAFGLAQAGETVTVHRLVAQIISQAHTPEQKRQHQAAAAAVLVAAAPGYPEDHKSWPAWAAVLPHLIAQDLRTTSDAGLHELACGALRLLFRQGSVGVSRDLAARLHEAWASSLGVDHPDTLECAHHLGRALRMSAETSQARKILADTLARRTRVLGPDHPDTLTSAHEFAATLYVRGETSQAREIFEDVHTRRMRALGEDHSDTLVSAHSLAADLRLLGRTDEARDMDQDTFARRRRVLGENHPDTLASAHNLAADLRVLGRTDEARDMDQDTLARRRRVLGENHPDTLASAHNLAADLRELGETSWD